MKEALSGRIEALASEQASIVESIKKLDAEVEAASRRREKLFLELVKKEGALAALADLQNSLSDQE